MPVRVDPSLFSPSRDNTPATVLNTKERELLLKKPATVLMEGDVYTSKLISFPPQSTRELQREQIELDPQLQTTLTSTTKKVDDRVLVAFRDPVDPEQIRTMKLDKAAFEQLQKHFSDNDFFRREDGIMRLKEDAERYVASWLYDIAHTRGYADADADGNGKIEAGEKGALALGFDHRTEYDYLGEKVTALRSATASRYHKYSDTQDFMNKQGGLAAPGVLQTQVLDFEDTVEKELSHTIRMDKDMNGTVSLQEGLEDKSSGSEPLRQHLIAKAGIEHTAWINHTEPLLRPDLVESRDISLPQIKTWQERREELEQMKRQAKESMRGIDPSIPPFNTTA